MIEELLRLLAGLARRLERLEVQEGIPVWADWTPTVTQSVSVTVTVNEAKYAIIGKVCHIYAKLTCTSAGTAANEIVIAGMPAAAQPALTSNYFVVGSGIVRDAGTTLYHVGIVPTASDNLKLLVDQNAGFLGSTPAYTIANTDEIGFTATYRIA